MYFKRILFFSEIRIEIIRFILHAQFFYFNFLFIIF